MSRKVFDNRIEIAEDAVKTFFEGRTAKFNAANPYISVLYQDLNPELALQRDKKEKEKLMPLLGADKSDTVLDIGCGIGRWADILADKVQHYHGIDLTDGLIQIAKKRFEGQPHVTFQTLRAQDLPLEGLYSKVLIAGVLVYLNDLDCLRVLSKLTRVARPRAKILIREPIGVTQRLTLDSVWSEELQCNYSAIYRSRTEFLEMFEKTLFKENIILRAEERLFDAQLSNRKETAQHFFVLEKS